MLWSLCPTLVRQYDSWTPLVQLWTESQMVRRGSIYIQCSGNYIEVKKIQLSAWNWHFKKFLTRYSGCPEGWFLRVCVSILAKAMPGSASWVVRRGSQLWQIADKCGERGWDCGECWRHTSLLTLMLLVANFPNTKRCKKPEKWPKPLKWVLIWEYSVRAF